MSLRSLLVSAAIVSAVCISMAVATQEQKHRSTPDEASSGMKHDEMNKRGDHVMGFDHLKTTHHFRLLEHGGEIAVAANSARDTESRDQIRMHLAHIAKMFAEGNFNAPMLIHDQVPPGVANMKELTNRIEYKFEETDRGAVIHIVTTDADALKAIHEFRRFQIKKHETGDSKKVQRD